MGPRDFPPRARSPRARDTDSANSSPLNAHFTFKLTLAFRPLKRLRDEHDESVSASAARADVDITDGGAARVAEPRATRFARGDSRSHFASSLAPAAVYGVRPPGLFNRVRSENATPVQRAARVAAELVAAELDAAELDAAGLDAAGLDAPGLDAAELAAAWLDAFPPPERARRDEAAAHVTKHADRYDAVLRAFADKKGLDMTQTRRLAAKLLEMVNEQYGNGAFLKTVAKLHDMNVGRMSEDSFGIERLESLLADRDGSHDEKDVVYAHEIHLTVAEAKVIVRVAYEFCVQNSNSNAAKLHLEKMLVMLELVGDDRNFFDPEKKYPLCFYVGITRILGGLKKRLEKYHARGPGLGSVVFGSLVWATVRVLGDQGLSRIVSRALCPKAMIDKFVVFFQNLNVDVDVLEFCEAVVQISMRSEHYDLLGGTNLYCNALGTPYFHTAAVKYLSALVALDKENEKMKIVDALEIMRGDALLNDKEKVADHAFNYAHIICNKLPEMTFENLTIRGMMHYAPLLLKKAEDREAAERLVAASSMHSLNLNEIQAGFKNAAATVKGSHLRRLDLIARADFLQESGTHSGSGLAEFLRWASTPGLLNGEYAAKGELGGRAGCSFSVAERDALEHAKIGDRCDRDGCANMKHWHKEKNNGDATDVYWYCQRHQKGRLAARLFKATPAVIDAADEIDFDIPISRVNASVVAFPIRTLMLAGYGEPARDISERIWRVIGSFNRGFNPDLPFGFPDRFGRHHVPSVCGRYNVAIKRPTLSSGSMGDRCYTVYLNPPPLPPRLPVFPPPLKVKICFINDVAGDKKNFYLACFERRGERASLAGVFVRVPWPTERLGLRRVGVADPTGAYEPAA